MKRLFNYALLALALLACASDAPAQPRRGSRPSPQARPTATPTPAPTPVPVQTIAETPLQPGQRARFDVNHYRVIAELNPAQHLLTAAGRRDLHARSTTRARSSSS